MNVINDFMSVFQMQFRRSSGFIVFFALIQIMLSLGIVIGFTYLMPSPDKDTILYLATGAPTLVLIITGLNIVPQQIAAAKAEGYIEFIRTWPVSRGIIIAADTLLWLLVTIPGIAVASLCAHFIFDPGYAISWTIIPALFLIAVTCIGVGYGFAYALPPNLSLSLSQVIVFGALMFSPINFPVERLPEWLAAVHAVLPLHAMAEVTRASMASSSFTASAGSYMTLAIWCIAGYVGAMLILNSNKRR
ncbi:ABC transporter permease [Paenibacillaceae bacterium]|nr:ABC transporter permease [Paenibacillaceae bacterium]